MEEEGWGIGLQGPGLGYRVRARVRVRVGVRVRWPRQKFSLLCEGLHSSLPEATWVGLGVGVGVLGVRVRHEG